MITLGVFICLSNMGSLLLVLLAMTMASVGAEGLDPSAHQNFCVADLKSRAPLPVSLHSMASSIPMFNGTNFLDWSEQVRFHLSALDLDLALRSKKPTGVTHVSSMEEKAFLRTWERSNRLSIMFMRTSIDNKIKSTLPEAHDAREYLKLVEERFHNSANESAKVGKLIAKLTTMKFDGNRGIHEHVLEMTNLATRLKTLGMNVDETFLIQFIWNSLPPQYRRLQVHYNTKKKWNANELASMLVQNEARLKQQGILSLDFVGRKVGTNEKKSKKDKNKNLLKVAGASRSVEKHNSPRCKSCRKYGRIQKDFLKQREGFEKKD